MSNALTEHVRVTVQSTYLPQHSSPDDGRFVFAYTVELANEGPLPVQLLTRHWVITDGRGRVEEGRGPGVVGETPRLENGQTFQYTSGCVLDTPRGTMHGSYQMIRDDGHRFDAEIAPFVLSTPGAESERVLN
ncbi:MAG: Co2+/Mg2+ efflux protein ApaG [Deltaproteobacteria bacterium]|nr:Co2+/Mg2+ efflux protein ApaG [Deltaproteobacteria bacterium]